MVGQADSKAGSMAEKVIKRRYIKNNKKKAMYIVNTVRTVNLDVKTPAGKKTVRTAVKLKISFDDNATSTYEYPSEQSLLEGVQVESEEDEFIFDNSTNDNDHEDLEEDINGTGLKSTPGLGSGGGLATYKSRFSVDYQFGMDVHRNEPKVQSRAEPPKQKPEDMQIKPADDDDTYTWSETTSSDMLF